MMRQHERLLMARLHDYLAWRGDILFDERQFNEVDNVICSLLSYVDIVQLTRSDHAASHAGAADAAGAVANAEVAEAGESSEVAGAGEETKAGKFPEPPESAESRTRSSYSDPEGLSIAELCRRATNYAAQHTSVPVCSVAQIDAEFLLLLGSSARFAHARIHHIEELFDEDKPLQFFACCIDLTPQLTYIAFRGTDSTLTGWREDFTMSFAVTPAQEEAARYAQTMVKQALAAGKQVMLGGHSKGGLLAAYAGYKLPDNLLEGVVRVWSNDGPDMDAELLGERLFDRLHDKLISLVPGYSVVGTLLEDPRVQRFIVQSSQKGSYQHDAMSWEVDASGFILRESLEPEAAFIQQTIDDWARTLEPHDRAHLTTMLFDLLESSGEKTLGEAFSHPAALSHMLANTSFVDAHVRELLGRLISTVITNAKDSVVEGVKQQVDSVVAQVNKVRGVDSAARKDLV